MISSAFFYGRAYWNHFPLVLHTNIVNFTIIYHNKKKQLTLNELKMFWDWICAWNWFSRSNRIWWHCYNSVFHSNISVTILDANFCILWNRSFQFIAELLELLADIKLFIRHWLSVFNCDMRGGSSFLVRWCWTHQK